MFEWIGDLSGGQIILLVVLVSVTGSALAQVVRAFFRHREPPKRSAEFERRMEARMEQMERSIEAMALDVERIAEAQRFATRLLAEGRGARAEPIAGPGEYAPQPREVTHGR